MDNQQRQQVLQQLQSANNVLVTVSTNPTVDELAASIALTIVLNRMEKHATTVFSGVVPSTLEFLQPEKTIETTTDSLRDFIIALDKSKADKLRYKVEDDVVRIFITPYRTSITDQDLEFSQGDFNVDAVIALGVTQRSDLDTTVAAHGRILHDATVVSITKGQKLSDLGTINWHEDAVSSLCEMVASIVGEFGQQVIDPQVATSLLTGIVAETDRFKNEKTTPFALSLSSQLMAAGANQQLIAEKLEAPAQPPMPLAATQEQEAPAVQPETSKINPDGSLDIDHKADDEELQNIHIDENGNMADMSPQHSVDAEEIPEVPVAPEPEVPVLPLLDSDEEPAASEPESDAGIQTIQPPSGTDDQEEASSSDDVVAPQNEGSLAAVDSSNDEPRDMPMMQHQKVIQPLDDDSRSDKPFDLNEALKAAQEDSNKPAEDATASQPEQPPETLAAAPSHDSNSSAPQSLAELEQAVGSPHSAVADIKEKIASSQGQTLSSIEQNLGSDRPQPIQPAQPSDGPVAPPPPPGSGQTAPPSSSSPPPVPPPMTASPPSAPTPHQVIEPDGSSDTNSNPFLNPR